MTECNIESAFAFAAIRDCDDIIRVPATLTGATMDQHLPTNNARPEPGVVQPVKKQRGLFFFLAMLLAPGLLRLVLALRLAWLPGLLLLAGLCPFRRALLLVGHCDAPVEGKCELPNSHRHRRRCMPSVDVKIRRHMPAEI